MSSNLEFVVTGKTKIHCEGCETRIGNGLKRLSGVRFVESSAREQRVIVMIDPTEVGPDQIVQRLAELGYEVTRAER